MEQQMVKKQQKNTKKKGRKKTYGLSKIQRLQNLNEILMAMKQDKSYTEIDYIQRQSQPSSKKKIKTKISNKNLKLAQKVEKMTEFWKTIDQHYFCHDQEKLVEKLKKFGAEKDQLKFNDLEKFSLNKHERILKDKFFEISENSQINSQNKQNFIDQLCITQSTYLKALLLIKQKKILCESCQNKFQISFKAKFQFQMKKNLSTEKDFQKYLIQEQKQLQKINKNYDIEFCQQCNIQPQKNKAQKKLDNLCLVLDQNQKEIQNYKNFIIKKISQKNHLVNYNAAVEMELIKNFLYIHLIEIEKKLLADNIELIIGKKKQIVYIKFIQFDHYYPLTQDELDKLNQYREQSLFKIHLVSYKTIRPHYTYNTALQHITKTLKPLSQETLRKESKTLLTLKHYIPQQKNYICHHCKFIGNKNYFYNCIYKAEKHKDKNTSTDRQIFKRFFNLQNEFKNICDKKYCLYCVKNCYHQIIKCDRHEWICPFCSGSCYCLSCEYRDHYMRLFSLFKIYNGDVKLLHQNSPIEKVIQYYIRIIQQNQDQNMKQDRDIRRKRGRRRVIVKINQQQNDEDYISNNINKYIQKRKDLIEQLQMTKLLKKREKIKLEILQNF